MKEDPLAGTGESPMKHTKDDGTMLSNAPQVTLISTELQIDLHNESVVVLKKHSSWRLCFLKVLESYAVTIIMSIVTLYALFGDDIKTLAFGKSSDNAFSALVTICIILFSLELLLFFFLKPEYRWSFYFWLDLIATLSLIADLSWIWDSALGLGSDSSSRENLKNAGNASRAGKRTKQVLTIIRIIRLVRIVKLYKNVQNAFKKFEKKKNYEDEESVQVENVNESNVGKQMSEVTMKRTIVIVLTLLFILPIFETSFYYSSETSWEFGLKGLSSFINQHNFEVVKQEYIEYHKDDLRPIVYLQYTNATGFYEWNSETLYGTLRYYEIYYSSTGPLIVIFDLRFDAKLTSLLNIMRTIFICIVLTLGAIYFNKDAERLVIKPIEKMIEKVKIIAKNPMAASDAKASENEEKTEKTCCGLFTSVKKTKQYETQLLENTIVKIGVLLALGFGEAGSIIIGANVEKGGGVDPMMQGTKVVGIYGFCDIRNFTDTTEELQEGVMMFVNEIAQVVHGLVDKYMGAANKNIGDAFLLVWKFGNDEFFLEENDRIVRNPHSLRAHYVPDLALLSFLKILAKVNKDPEILKYRTNQKLIARMPNYEVKMGFGMHLGSAIEGAIGSQFKIDASYLSPNVNVASALEGSTKIYGVPLLISDALYNTFSEPIQKYCRQIDTVMIKGNSRHVKLYTSDCDFSEFVPLKTCDRSKNFFTKKKRILKKELDRQNTTTEQIFKESNEVQLMRKGFTQEFYQSFEIGMKFYVEGEWGNAKAQLEKTLMIRSKDGPSISLLNLMSEYAFKSPSDWAKARYLG